MNEIIDHETGEITPLPSLDIATFEAARRTEIESMIAAARRFPRPMARKIQEELVQYAQLDEEVAAELRYALPRGKNENGTAKVITGPSIRFAELVSQLFGNCRVETRITEINTKDKFVEAEGTFTDFQTGLQTLSRVRSRIVNKYGKLYNDDMILTTQNAAASKARRNAIIQGVNKAIWNKAYQAAEQVIMGDIKTLSNRRASAISAFTNFGLAEDKVLLLVGVEKAEDIGLDALANLRSMYASLRNEETTVEDLMRGLKSAEPAHEVLENPLKDGEGEEGPKKEAAPKKATTGKKAAPAKEEQKPAEQQQPVDDAPPATEEQVDNSDPFPPEQSLPDTGLPATTPATDLPADDLPADKPKEQKAEPVAEKPKPTAPKDAPLPTDETEYDAYARAYIAEATSASELEERFKGERKLRNACSVTSETLEVLKEELADKLTALRG